MDKRVTLLVPLFSGCRASFTSGAELTQRFALTPNLLRPSSLTFSPTARPPLVGPHFIPAEKALCKLSSTVLQRVARGSGRWTELTLDGLNKLMLLVEERLFPGDELAAAMAAAAAAATVAAGGDSHQENGGGEAGGLGVVGGAAEGHRPALGSSGGQSSFDMEGSWGEDETAAGSLSHLVECMLEVRG